jgi:hypothetical protein
MLAELHTCDDVVMVWWEGCGKNGIGLDYSEQPYKFNAKTTLIPRPFPIFSNISTPNIR